MEIVDVKRENCPAARLIGKSYAQGPDWGQWWSNGWFGKLEVLRSLEFNGDAYIGAVHIVDGAPEYWIGRLFPAGTRAPEGFGYVDIEPQEYAVCYLRDREGSGGFYTMDTHNMCLNELSLRGYKRREDSWCLERYNCPRFTTPDENGDIILDYAIAIEK